MMTTDPRLEISRTALQILCQWKTRRTVSRVTHMLMVKSFDPKLLHTRSKKAAIKAVMFSFTTVRATAAEN